MSIEQKIKELTNKLTESLESIAAVKGNDFARIVNWGVAAGQMTRNLARLAQDHLPQEHSERLRDEWFSVMELSLAIMTDLAKMSKEDADAVNDWILTLYNHVEQTEKEIQK